MLKVVGSHKSPKDAVPQLFASEKDSAHPGLPQTLSGSDALF